MGMRIIVKIEGVQETIDHLSEIQAKARQNLEHQNAELAKATEQNWKQNTHRRSGRMQSEESVDVQGLKFTMNNTTNYYDWVNDGHNTPRGWHTKRGFRPAKHRHWVEGQHMTDKTTDFVAENATDYLSKFLDNV